MTDDPYGHVFLEVTKSGEKYCPPPNSSAVVSLHQCSVCLIPQMCLVFMANISNRVQPSRACKQKGVTRSKQQLETADSMEGDNPRPKIEELLNLKQK